MAMMYSYTTMTLRDVIKLNPDLFNNMQLSTTARTEEFINRFKAIYNNKSIGAETVTLFRYWIEDKFNEVKPYYEQKLDIYERELNGDLGIIINRTKSETSHSRIDNTSQLSHQQNNSEDTTNYDLPRTSATAASPTTKTSVTGNVNGTNSNTSASEGDGSNSTTETVTGDVNIVEQRNKWLKFVRDLYSEMANEFKNCFAIIYG